MRSSRATLLLLLALRPGEATATGAACGPPPEAEKPASVFVILVGHPEAPAHLHLQPLHGTDDDVRHMHEFFRILSPRHVFLHARDASGWRPDSPETVLSLPTWAALLKTRERLLGLLAEAPEPRLVYVYYSGHGRKEDQGPRARTIVYLEPDPRRPDDPGYNGSLPSTLLGQELLDPLGKLATVHLVVDVCQSVNILQTKGWADDAPIVGRRVVKTFPVASREEMIDRFIDRHPRVGALLATYGSQAAVEGDVGGLFSFAIRSSGLGPADFDGDAVLTYEEMNAAITQILKGKQGTAPPGFVGPGGDPRAPFLDLRRARAARRICFSPQREGRYELFDGDRTYYAALYPASETPLPAWFPNGRRYFAVHREDRGERGERLAFVVDDHADFSAIAEAADSVRMIREELAAKGIQRFAGEPYDAPLRRDLGKHEPPSRYFDDRSYAGVGASTAFTTFLGRGAAELDALVGASLRVHRGRRGRQLGLELRWSRRSVDREDNPLRYTADLVSANGTVMWMLFEGRTELSLGPFLGAGRYFQQVHNTEATFGATLLRGGLALDAVLPVPEDAQIGLRTGLSAGAQWLCSRGCGDPDVAPVLALSLGGDWEIPLD